jgi:hypothetical protein
VPAAAVIPAPIAYTNVVAVKKLVVGCLAVRCLARLARVCAAGASGPSFWRAALPFTGQGWDPDLLL